MIIEKGRVRAPEIGRIWLNSPPLNLQQLRGRVVLIDFWDYTCVNCLRTLPYVQEWHHRYENVGLTVIGIHTPEFTFAQNESHVEGAVRQFGLSYPIAIDSDYELWRAFANRYWPAKYLVDHEGYVRYAHFGEGAYLETEEQIQKLLHEVNPAFHPPVLMSPQREEDTPGAVCYRPSPELYLGHRRGHLGNEGGFHPDSDFEYTFGGEPQQGAFYLNGIWRATAEYAELAGNGGYIVARYSAAAVNLVMDCAAAGGSRVEIIQDRAPLAAAQAGADVALEGGRSYVNIPMPRMYSLVDNHSFGTHTLQLRCPSGLRAYAFTFTSCVDPAASLPAAGEVAAASGPGAGR